MFANSKKLYIHDVFKEIYYIVGIKNIKKSQKNFHWEVHFDSYSISHSKDVT